MTINIRKSGTAFDLPIAIGLLAAMGIVDQMVCDEYLFVGEMGLNGNILPVNGQWNLTD